VREQGKRPATCAFAGLCATPLLLLLLVKHLQEAPGRPLAATHCHFAPVLSGPCPSTPPRPPLQSSSSGTSSRRERTTAPSPAC
jgi:hypothetical protein